MYGFVKYFLFNHNWFNQRSIAALITGDEHRVSPDKFYPVAVSVKWTQ